MESSLDLGHKGPEMPPKAWSNMWLWRDPAGCKLALASCLYKDYIMTTASCWPWKEFTVEIRNKALCALGKTQKDRPSESRMFSGKGFYEPSFSPLLAPRETLMAWPNVWPWFSWLAPRELFCFPKPLGHVSLTFLLSWLLLEYSKSPSDSLTRLFPGQHPDNAETSRLIIPWALISFCKCILAESRQRGPRAPRRPYSLKKPERSSPLFHWDRVPKCLRREIGRWLDVSRVSKGAKELALKIKRGRMVETQGWKSRENWGGMECRNREPDPDHPSLPHGVTTNGFQVLLSSITCLPS